MAARDYLQRAVLPRFGPQREPRGDQRRLIKRPVADVLMPKRRAAVPGMFGHHAVVVALRQQNLVPFEDELQPGEHRWMCGQITQQITPRISVQQPAWGVSARGFARRGRTRVTDVRLVFHRTNQRLH